MCEIRQDSQHHFLCFMIEKFISHTTMMCWKCKQNRETRQESPFRTKKNDIYSSAHLLLFVIFPLLKSINSLITTAIMAYSLILALVQAIFCASCKGESLAKFFQDIVPKIFLVAFQIEEKNLFTNPFYLLETAMSLTDFQPNRLIRLLHARAAII